MIWTFYNRTLLMVMGFEKLHLSRALLPKSGTSALNFAPCHMCTSASSRHRGTIWLLSIAPNLFHPLLSSKLRVLSCLRRVNGQSLTFALSKNKPILHHLSQYIFLKYRCAKCVKITPSHVLYHYFLGKQSLTKLAEFYSKCLISKPIDG